MEPPPLCTLPPGPGPPRFVCYCEGEGGGPGERGGFNLWWVVGPPGLRGVAGGPA